MDPERIAPELRRSASRAGMLSPGRALDRAVARAALALMPARHVAGVTVDVVRAAGPGVRVYRPRAVRSPAALFWIHGGGFVIGRAVQNDRLCGETAATNGIVVVSVEYRKAPGHPFPAALDDCEAGWRWVQGEARALGIDPSRVAVGGESAGGGLAACLAQRLRDRGDRQPAAQWLFCPMLDDRTAARRELDAVDHLVWNNRANRFGWRSYLAVEPGSPSVPVYGAAARNDDLAGLPPAWIGVGEVDLFHDEDIAYAGRLRAAGVDVTVDVVPGAPHGFEVWAPDSAMAQAHLARGRAWLRATLDEAPGLGG